MAEIAQSKGLSVQDAVRLAASHLQQLFPSSQHMLLEEVELSEDDRYWLVTLSFIDPGAVEGLGKTLANAFGTGPRKYKIVKIDRATGQVRSVKIRELEHV